MNKIEVNNILDFISMNYPDFKVTDDLFDMWLDELQQYDYQDVINKLKEMLATGYHNSRPPILMNIVNGLTKKSKKIDWKKQVVLCKHCNKGFNVDEKGYSSDLKEHEDKCGSINYVISQTKKWFGKELTRAELWNMEKKEFEQRYDKLLHYIYEHTTNPVEKDVISYIWNPPSAEKTKQLFGIKEEDNDK